MSNKVNINCPNCGYSFNVEDVLSHKLEEQYKAQLEKEKDELNKQLKEKDNLIQIKISEIESSKKNSELQLKKMIDDFENDKQKAILEQNKQKLELENQIANQEIIIANKLNLEKKKLEDTLKNQIKNDFDFELKTMQDKILEKESKLNELKQKALENEELKAKLLDLETEVKTKLQKEFNQQRDLFEKNVAERIYQETEKSMRDKDHQLDVQKKLIDELKRKAEQGSMQAQGEVQELAIEKELTELFRFDLIEEVPKGVKGADCIQIVRNERAEECGRICYESKRTKTFGKDWIAKLKDDRIRSNSDLAVLITEVLPEDIKKIGTIDDIWVCDFEHFKGLAMALRYGLINIHKLRQAQSNKGEKMHMLYDYLTSHEFKSRLDTIIEGFEDMKGAITKERVQMEKQWKEREKMLDRVIISTAAMYGEIQGIAGSSVPEYELLEPKQKSLLG